MHFQSLVCVALTCGLLHVDSRPQRSYEDCSAIVECGGEVKNFANKIREDKLTGEEIEEFCKLSRSINECINHSKDACSDDDLVTEVENNLSLANEVCHTEEKRDIHIDDSENGSR